MTIKTTLLAALLCFTLILRAQVGATAPDFTVTDLDGNSHHLYEYLDAGKVVIVDVSATWCDPCWEFHNASFLEDIQTIYGPEGTDQVRVLFYEGDAATTLADLQGLTTATMGDWLTYSNYPIINESPLSLNLNVWAPTGFPTINVIRPSDKEIVEDLWNQWAQNPKDDVAAFEAMQAVIESSVAVEEITQATWNIYPNPTKGLIRLSANDVHGQYVQIDITNTLGQIVYSKQLRNQEISNTMSIDLSALAKGNYVIRMIDETSVVTKNISIQ